MLETAMQKGELTHTFSILAKRGSLPYSEAEIEAMDLKQLRYLVSQSPGAFGCSYMELRNPAHDTDQYYYDWQPHEAPLYAGFSYAALAFFCLPASAQAFFAPLAAFMLAGVLPGQLRKQEKPTQCYEERLDFDISKETYDGIKNHLDSRVGKYGVYSLLFNNCTHYAARTARKFGLKPPRGFILNTPDILSRKIRKLSHDSDPEKGKALPLRNRLTHPDYSF